MKTDLGYFIEKKRRKAKVRISKDVWVLATCAPGVLDPLPFIPFMPAHMHTHTYIHTCTHTHTHTLTHSHQEKKTKDLRVHGQDFILVRITRVSLRPCLSLVCDTGNKMSQ